MPNIYDVEFVNLAQLGPYHEVECHVVVYPYSRKVSSSSINIYPYEEYIQDVLAQQRSAYARLQSHFNEIFGLSLGLLIALIFWALKPEELFSIESIVSVFGAYIVGKELWDDLDRALVEISKNWPIRYRDSYYQYVLEKHTTLTAYSAWAKEKRYGKAMILPIKVDFIKQSNSQTVRMLFDARDFKRSGNAQEAHILSIHVDPAVQNVFEAGFMFGVKLSLNRRGFLGITRHLELFQSLSEGELGCLDEHETWVPHAIFYRQTFSVGRVKYFMHKGVISGCTLIDCSRQVFSPCSDSQQDSDPNQ